MKELKEIQELNRQIFNLFEGLFVEAFGILPQRFSPIDNFGSEIKKISQKQKQNILSAVNKYLPEIQNFYNKNDSRMFQLLGIIGGLKYVLGGGSRFLTTQFKAVKSMALYGDTILIPDPVLPWLETERIEEKFHHILFLEQIFIILHFKPLVDANLPYPAISVFPSWEKFLEKNDSITKTGVERLVTNFFSFYLQIPFTAYEEIISYVKKNPDTFLKKVDDKNLFIAPGQEPQSIYNAIKHYREYIDTWRSSDYKDTCKTYSDAEIVWLGINERLAPQFHWWENSNELKAHPLACLDVQWHYHQLTSKMLLGMINSNVPKPLNPLESYIQLNNKHFKWLGNLTVEELVRLREEGENEEFRSNIKKNLDHLNAASIQDVDDVAVEVAKTISSLINKHQRNIKKINNRYFKKYGKTILITGIAASFFPALAPVAIASTVTVAGANLVWDISEHVGDLKRASKSLMGVLAKYSKMNMYEC